MRRKISSATRRKFIRQISSASVAASLPAMLRAGTNEKTHKLPLRNYAQANDQIQVALIGAGGMGSADAHTASTVPGVKIIAACDLYDPRLEQAKKNFGNEIFVTRDYREILHRKEVDGVIIGTPDHWHQAIAIDALQAGKHVYCEKPMVQQVSEGAAVVEAQNKSGKILQVGSQGLSSLGNEKAKELFENGAIGQLNYVEGFWARNTPGGAWQYDLPVDASEKNLDWNRFLKDKPRRAFDPKRFFRWRCFKDYGTGVCGDLFVHLISSLHFIISSAGPTKVMATGGLRYWKDGREVPDIMLAMFDYPETRQHPAFNLSLRVNFVDSNPLGSYFRMVGNEGSMTIEWEKVTLTRNFSYPPDNYAAVLKAKQYAPDYDRKEMMDPEVTEFKVQNGYKGAHFDHLYHWVSAIRTGKKPVEDALFGFRAAAPALLCNDSYFGGKPVNWDPENLKL